MGDNPPWSPTFGGEEQFEQAQRRSPIPESQQDAGRHRNRMPSSMPDSSPRSISDVNSDPDQPTSPLQEQLAGAAPVHSVLHDSTVDEETPRNRMPSSMPDSSPMSISDINSDPDQPTSPLQEQLAGAAPVHSVLHDSTVDEETQVPATPEGHTARGAPAQGASDPNGQDVVPCTPEDDLAPDPVTDENAHGRHAAASVPDASSAKGPTHQPSDALYTGDVGPSRALPADDDAQETQEVPESPHETTLPELRLSPVSAEEPRGALQSRRRYATERFKGFDDSQPSYPDTQFNEPAMGDESLDLDEDLRSRRATRRSNDSSLRAPSTVRAPASSEVEGRVLPGRRLSPVSAEESRGALQSRRRYATERFKGFDDSQPSYPDTQFNEPAMGHGSSDVDEDLRSRQATRESNDSSLRAPSEVKGGAAQTPRRVHSNSRTPGPVSTPISGRITRHSGNTTYRTLMASNPGLDRKRARSDVSPPRQSASTQRSIRRAPSSSIPQQTQEPAPTRSAFGGLFELAGDSEQAAIRRSSSLFVPPHGLRLGAAPGPSGPARLVDLTGELRAEDSEAPTSLRKTLLPKTSQRRGPQPAQSSTDSLMPRSSLQATPFFRSSQPGVQQPAQGDTRTDSSTPRTSSLQATRFYRSSDSPDFSSPLGRFARGPIDERERLRLGVQSAQTALNELTARITAGKSADRAWEAEVKRKNAEKKQRKRVEDEEQARRHQEFAEAERRLKRFDQGGR